MMTPEWRQIYTDFILLLHHLKACELDCVVLDHHDAMAGDVSMDEAELMEKCESFRNLWFHNVSLRNKFVGSFRNKDQEINLDFNKIRDLFTGRGS